MHVALGLIGLVNILDSELVVVSGGLVNLGDVLLDPIRGAFAGHLEGSAHRPPVPIVAAELGGGRRARRRGGAGAPGRGCTAMSTRIGITLPSFRTTAEASLAVAHAAEAAGLDGVFAYDHLFRRTVDGTRRPAIEMFAMLGAVAAETSRIAVGSLVARDPAPAGHARVQVRHRRPDPGA